MPFKSKSGGSAWRVRSITSRTELDLYRVKISYVRTTYTAVLYCSKTQNLQNIAYTRQARSSTCQYVKLQWCVDARTWHSKQHANDGQCTHRKSGPTTSLWQRSHRSAIPSAMKCFDRAAAAGSASVNGYRTSACTSKWKGRGGGRWGGKVSSTSTRQHPKCVPLAASQQHAIESEILRKVYTSEARNTWRM